MPTYLALATYKQRTTIDASIVTLCENKGKDVAWWLESASAQINTRLAKRYAVDFASPGPVPDQIIFWLIRLVNIDVWECAGGLPEGREDGWADAARKQVYEEIKEAADAENGLYELPLRNTDPLGASAINKGGPMVVSFNTIYGHFDAQAADRDGGGW